ncbi:MAG: type II toxin-antitoxin system VapC family toxin [Promethearchaeota archaeon]
MNRSNKIFIDTSFIIAFFNKKDKNHPKARKIFQKSMEMDPETKFVYSDYVFDELITFLKARKIPVKKISKIGDNILGSNIWKIIRIDEESFNQSWEMIKKYHDKEWSFTDSTSFIIMVEMNILCYLSYDEHFGQYLKIQKWEI